jgi:hypothetical protein
LPKDFPTFTTVQYYFYRLRDGGVLDLINEALVEIARRLAGRGTHPRMAQPLPTPCQGLGGFRRFG